MLFFIVSIVSLVIGLSGFLYADIFISQIGYIYNMALRKTRNEETAKNSEQFQ